VERLRLLADRIVHVIDFRYHLVSIVAVFLALAIGIVFGSTALKGKVAEQLEGQAASLTESNRRLQEQVREQELVQSGNDELARQLAPTVLKDLLSGQSVVFVELPSAADNVRTGLDTVVRQAGATVSGRVTILDNYLAEDKTPAVNHLVTELAQGRELPEGTPYERAGAELAGALVTNQPSQAGQEDRSSGQVLSAFQSAGFLSLTPKFGGRATLALVIPPSAPMEGKSAASANAAMVALAGALDRTGRGAVMAGPPGAAVDGGAIAVLRDDDVSATVSSNDAADSPAGQIVAAYALARELDGKSGQYGTGSGADEFLPTPAPAPPKP
jgi:hypothetical protein